MAADPVAVATRTRDAVSGTPAPARAAALAAASLAGGLAVGARMAPKRRGWLPGRRRRVLGIRVGREPASVTAAKAMADGARRLVEATRPLTSVAEDAKEIREQLERANRRSPIEVVLDGLTHRRGAHRREG